jgi:hypothetical protein
MDTLLAFQVHMETIEILKQMYPGHQIFVRLEGNNAIINIVKE